MKTRDYTFEEYIEKAKDFHGSIDPDMIAAWFMVVRAKQDLTGGDFVDIICETIHCLPDAVQILTPCTLGNGLLRIIETSRFALTMHGNNGTQGTRVFLDLTKLDVWPEIRCWFLKEKPRNKQNPNLVIEELKEAETSIYSLEHVKIKPELLEAKSRLGSAIRPCPSCGEAYRTDLGDICPACRGKGPFFER